MTYVKIGNSQIEASISGRTRDNTWNDRASKTIVLAMTYEEVSELFVDNVIWSIVYYPESYVDPETGETVTPEAEEYDNSEYSIAGPITDNRDGTVVVKMGKPTEVEEILAELEKEVASNE